MTPLLTAKDIAVALNTHAETAKKIMAEHHISPALDLGTGSTRGLRWTRQQLEELIQGAMPLPRRVSKYDGSDVFSGSYKEAMGK